jgi:hypothetical protein
MNYGIANSPQRPPHRRKILTTIFAVLTSVATILGVTGAIGYLTGTSSLQALVNKLDWKRDVTEDSRFDYLCGDWIWWHNRVVVQVSFQRNGRELQRKMMVFNDPYESYPDTGIWKPVTIYHAHGSDFFQDTPTVSTRLSKEEDTVIKLGPYEYFSTRAWYIDEKNMAHRR